MTDGIIQESFNHFRAITRMNRYEKQLINTLEQDIIEKIRRIKTDRIQCISNRQNSIISFYEQQLIGAKQK